MLAFAKDSISFYSIMQIYSKYRKKMVNVLYYLIRNVKEIIAI